MPQLLAERGYQVLYLSLRGTAGSGGKFDGFTIHPADAAGTLSWLREQPWFGGGWPHVAPATSVSPSGSRRPRHPGMEIAVIQDAPSEFAHQFMYPGGGFALGNALGWVQIVDRMFRTRRWNAPQFLGVFTGPKSMRRAVATLPVADADIALTGRRVPWFQEWIRHGPDDPYWQSSDHRANVARMPPVVYLQGGCTTSSSAGCWPTTPHCKPPAAWSGCLSGPGDMAAASTPASGCVTLCRAGRRTRRRHTTFWGAGVRYWFPPLDRPSRLATTRPRHRLVSASVRPAQRRPAAAGPPSRFRYDPADPTPSIAGTAVACPLAPPTTAASKPDRMFLPSPAIPKPPIWR